MKSWECWLLSHSGDLEHGKHVSCITAFTLLEILRPSEFVEIEMTWILHSILGLNSIYLLVPPSFWKMTLFPDSIIIVSWISFHTSFRFQHKEENSFMIHLPCQTLIMQLCNPSLYYLQGLFFFLQWENVSLANTRNNRGGMVESLFLLLQ